MQGNPVISEQSFNHFPQRHCGMCNYVLHNGRDCAQAKTCIRPITLATFGGGLRTSTQRAVVISKTFFFSKIPRLPALLHERCFSAPFLPRQRRRVMDSSREPSERVSRLSTRQHLSSSFRYLSLPRRPQRPRRRLWAHQSPQEQVVYEKSERVQRPTCDAQPHVRPLMPLHYHHCTSRCVVLCARAADCRALISAPSRWMRRAQGLPAGTLHFIRLSSKWPAMDSPSSREVRRMRVLPMARRLSIWTFYFCPGLSLLFIRLRRRQTPRSRLYPCANVSGLQSKHHR